MARRKRRPEDTWMSWSFSKLDTLLVCPLQFQFRYVERRQVPYPLLPVVGAALHYLASRFYAQHPNTKRYPYDTAEKLCNVWTAFWLGITDGKHGPKGFSAKGNPPNPPVEIAWNNRKSDRGYWIGRGQEILNTFFEINDPRRGTGAGIMCEKLLNFRWLGFAMLGVIDRIDDVEERVSIADYKMGNFSEEKLQDSIQLSIYQIGYREQLQARFSGRPLSGMKVETLSPRGTIHDAPLRDETEFLVLHRILTEASVYVEAVLTGRSHRNDVLENSKIFRVSDASDRTFFPRLPRGEHCRYCNHVKGCKEWERARRGARTGSIQPILNSSEVWHAVHAAAERAAMPGQLALPFPDIT